VVKLVLSGGNQTITKVCNHCGCHIEDLTIDDILVVPTWNSGSGVTLKDSQGNQITRTKLPNNLKECQCEECS
jgi:hypothetical protein